MEKLIYECLNPILKENIDALVLGCTHYTYLVPQIKKIIGNHIQIVDSGLAVAKQTQRVLNGVNLLNSSTNDEAFHHFYINKKYKVLVDILKNNNPVKVIEKEF